MAKRNPTPADVNTKLLEWAQGDCVLGETSFIFGFDPTLPGSEPTKALDVSGQTAPFWAEDQVRGLVVITQTCDVIRTMETRPYLEVAPIVEANDAQFPFIQKGLITRFAEIPALSGKKLVADLDRAMTVEKPLILQ